MSWATHRRLPYTEDGIKRLRCSRPAAYQWQICSDGNNFRPLCALCDVTLNRMLAGTQFTGPCPPGAPTTR